jgi:hypothetical protein
VIAVRTLDARIRPRLEAWKKDKRIATTTNHQPIARRFERAVLASGLEGAIALSDDDLSGQGVVSGSTARTASCASAVPPVIANAPNARPADFMCWAMYRM